MIRFIGKTNTFLLLFFCLLPLPQAATHGADEVIEDIRIEGTVRINPETFFYYIKTAIGDPYDIEALKTDFRAVYNTGLFDDVKISAQEGETGKIIIFRVKERPTIRNIEYRGAKVVSENTITEQFEKMNFELKIGLPLDMNKVYQGKEIIKLILNEEGLQFATVDHEVEEINESSANLVFIISEGDQIKIGRVDFTGNAAFDDDKLRKTLKKTRKTWMFSWITKNDIYSELRFQEDAENLRTLYYDNGYIDLIIKEPIIEINEQKSGFRRKVRKRLHITIPIVEGPMYRMGKLTVRGNTIIDTQRLVSRFGILEYDVFSRGAIEEGVRKIQEDYGELGYIFVSTIPNINQDTENLSVDVDLLIKENDKFYVNRIEFKGNTSTRDKVLRREMLLVEGELFNQKIFELSLLKLNQLGYFDEVTHDIKKVEGKNEVDVIVKVSESSKNSINFGGGYSGLEGAFASFAFSTRNLFGKGQTFTFQGQIGGRTQNFFVSYFEPFLFDKRVGAGISIFRRNLQYIDFTRKGVGGNVRLSRRLTNFVYTSIKYEYEVIEISDIAPSFWPPLVNPLNPDAETDTGSGDDFFWREYYARGKRRSSSITPVLTRDTINNPWDPIFGSRLLGSFQYAGSFLGGDLDFYKARVTATKFYPLSMKHILAGNIEYGYASGYGGQELPVYERYFIGGEQSIRGYPIRSIGPVDEYGNVVGGTQYVQVNLEYMYRIGQPMRIVVFFDAGNSFLSGEGLSNVNFRKSTGLEFRMFIPHLNIPLRLIVAYSLDPILDQQRVNFGFGFQPIF